MALLQRELDRVLSLEKVLCRMLKSVLIDADL